jgi:hypothetical protein
MATLSMRMEWVMQELAAIQEELNRMLVEDATNGSSPRLRTSTEDVEALRDLKSVVDQLRHFLWFYLQVVTEGSETAERTMQLLRHASKNPGTVNGANQLTFLERMNALTEYALVHYRDDGTGKPN